MRISVIIPTRDEEQNIARVIRHLRLTSDRETTEIIVVDGQSSDRTLEIARPLADQVIKIERPSRSRQMHEGALAANGNLLLFLHADTHLPIGWQKELTEAWSSNGKPAATAFRVCFDDGRFFYRLIAQTANWRAAWTGVPHGDQAIALSRDVYFKVGGFPPVPLLEEYFLFKKLKTLGRVQILSSSVTTSARRYEMNGRIFNTLRNSLIIFLYHLKLPLSFLARLYR